MVNVFSGGSNTSLESSVSILDTEKTTTLNIESIVSKLDTLVIIIQKEFLNKRQTIEEIEYINNGLKKIEK